MLRSTLAHVGVYLIILLIPQFVIAQESRRIMVSKKYLQKTIPLILSDFEEEFDISIIYKPEWISNDTINIGFNGIPLLEAIKQLTANDQIELFVFQNNYVLIPTNQIELITGKYISHFGSIGKLDYSQMKVIGEINGTKVQKAHLQGKILDGAIGETLIGATIMVNHSEYYTISGRNGEYSLDLNPGIYALTVSSVGFEDSDITIQLLNNGNLDIELFKKTQVIDELVIYAQKADKNISNNQMSIIELDSRMIKQLPAIVGEKDILKSLTMLPGVKTVGEFGSGINVRGGGEDQNLFLIEGAPIFNTSHAMGLLSVINPDAVSRVTLYKGHIPAEYGERVSSVMDIGIRNFDVSKKLSGSGGIGIYNSRLSLEGSLNENKFFYKLGGRINYSDYLLKQIPDYYLMNSSAKFHDVNALVGLQLKKDHFTLSGYYSYDYFKYASLYTFYYTNRLMSMSWLHRFTDDFASTVELAYSNYKVDRKDYTDSLSTFSATSDITYASAKLQFLLTRFSRHQLKFGLQAINYSIQPGTKTFIYDPEQPTVNMTNENGFEGAVYVNDLWNISDKISVQAGLRYAFYSYYGPHTVYSYGPNAPLGLDNVEDSTLYGSNEIISRYSGIEPRLSFKYQFSKSSAVKLSYNLNKQYISRISYTSISSPEDIWKLADPFIKPMEVHQAAVGYFQNFLHNRLESSVELYVKKMNNLIEYKNGALLSFNDHIETELTSASGYSYGLEILLKQNYGRIDGWISYTYSRSMVKTSGTYKSEMVNNNEWYPSQYDKPHDLTIFLNYHYNRRLRFGLNFNFTSGRSITLPEYVYKQGYNEIVYYSDRNKYRLPTYHRLDISVSYDESLRKAKKWKGSWTFSILNIYGRKNAYSIFYRREDPQITGNFKLFSTYKLYLIGVPMPVITYNFRF